MKKVETLLPEELIERLSAEAKVKGMHRSDLIRERLSQPCNHLGLTTNDFHKAVTKVRRRSMVWIATSKALSQLSSTNSSARTLGLNQFIFNTVRSLMNTARLP